jgi:hypothetical protein
MQAHLCLLGHLVVRLELELDGRVVEGLAIRTRLPNLDDLPRGLLLHAVELQLKHVYRLEGGVAVLGAQKDRLRETAQTRLHGYLKVVLFLANEGVVERREKEALVRFYFKSCRISVRNKKYIQNGFNSYDK